MELKVGEQIYKLHSKMPRRMPGGKFIMNFGGKFTKKSIKNAILVQGTDQAMITVRRIGEDDLEIENAGGFSDLVCFGFAVLSWLCRR
jgi:hypothetical protein